MRHQALLSCGFRPFFLASSIYAFVLLAMWIGFWNVLPVLPATLGGPIVWHAHELIFGFALAAVIGFLTTAVPEFTGKKELQGKYLLGLMLIWLCARISFWMSGVWGVIPSAVMNVLVLVVSLIYLAPVVWTDPGRRHMSFVYSIAVLVVLQCGFHAELAMQGNALRWLNASLAVYIVLIIVALSRISMRAINGLEEGIELHREPVEYIARPPRRNLAIFCVSLYAAVEFFAPTNSALGWLCFSAAAAMFNLLNDWHIGRAFFNRWIIAMYSIYCAIGLGFALGGYALLFDSAMLNAAKHILSIGGVAQAVLLVQIFVGQVHCGRPLNYYPWMTIALLSIAFSMVFRVVAVIYPNNYVPLISLSGVLWMLSFALYAVYFIRPLLSPSADGRSGC